MSRGSARRGLPPSAGNIPVPADRRFRRPDLRQPRNRSWQASLRRAGWYGGGALVVLALALWVGGSLLDAAALRVSEVGIRGNTRVKDADVMKALDGILAENVLRIDLEKYRARLLQSRWIADAELWRVLPSAVQVRIVERVPLAIARFSGQLYLASADGVVLDTFGEGYRELDLPIVDGALRSGRDGPVADVERMQLVQRLFAELATNDAWFRRVSQVDVTDARNAVLIIDGEPAQLRVGDRDFLAALRRYADLKSGLQKPVLEYYDLRFGDRIWVK